MQIVPEMYWINITEICENRCVWCYETDVRENEKQKIMETDTAFNIISAMAEAGAKDCILIGGEPMLHPNIFEIAAHAKQMGQQVFVVTNGRRFADENQAIKAKEVNIDLVQVSVHGWDEESYARYTRTNNGMQEMKQGIKNLEKHKVEHGISFVLSKYIEGNLEKVARLAQELDHDFVEFNIGAPAITPDEIDSSFVIPMERQSKVVFQAYEVCRKHNINVGFNLTMPHCFFTDEELQTLKKNATVSSGCALKTGSGVVFKIDGSMTVCNHFKDFELANAKETAKLMKNGFLEFWNSPEMKELREESNCYTSLVCSQCDYWKKCGGGCIASWTHFDPSNYSFRPLTIKT